MAKGILIKLLLGKFNLILTPSHDKKLLTTIYIN